MSPVADKKDNAGMGGVGADRKDNAGTGERHRGGDINAFSCIKGGQCRHEERALGGGFNVSPAANRWTMQA